MANWIMQITPWYGPELSTLMTHGIALTLLDTFIAKNNETVAAFFQQPGDTSVLRCTRLRYFSGCGVFELAHALCTDAIFLNIFRGPDVLPGK